MQNFFSFFYLLFQFFKLSLFPKDIIFVGESIFLLTDKTFDMTVILVYPDALIDSWKTFCSPDANSRVKTSQKEFDHNFIFRLFQNFQGNVTKFQHLCLIYIYIYFSMVCKSKMKNKVLQGLVNVNACLVFKNVRLYLTTIWQNLYWKISTLLNLIHVNIYFKSWNIIKIPPP